MSEALVRAAAPGAAGNQVAEAGTGRSSHAIKERVVRRGATSDINKPLSSSDEMSLRNLHWG